MSRREYYTQADKYSDILCLTDTSSVTEIKLTDYYKDGCRYFGLFLVGGGGAGSGDYYRNGHAGGGGGGGQVMSFYNIEISQNEDDVLSINIGTGGSGGTRNMNGESGKDTTVEYAGETYTAKGGYGGYSTNGKYSTGGSSVQQSPSYLSPYPRLENAAYGGQGGGYKTSNMISKYYTTPFDLDSLTYAYSIKGENGSLNPFDPGDTSYYGGAGGAGYNVQANQDYSSTYPNTGGQGGGGRGGYGTNNATTNKGANGTFYGAGGGGGAFSTNHVNSVGGSGYQGIACVYIYSPSYKPS